jgi:hypothetical protein
MSRINIQKSLVGPLLMSLSFLIFANPSLGMIRGYETAHVPVERLVKNLKEQVSLTPELETENEFKIARLYSIAYAQNDLNLPVAQHSKYEKLTDADIIYPDWIRQHWPRYRQFKSDSTEKNEDARNSLMLSIEHYRKALGLAEKKVVVKDRRTILLERVLRPLGQDLTDEDIKLGLAWSLQQVGDQDEAKKLYREVIATCQNMPVPSYPAVSAAHSSREQTADERRAFESALYLAPLLDSVQDKTEIETLSKLPKPDYRVRLTSPIVIPLASNLSARDLMQDADVIFDLGNGVRHYSSWPSSKAGWLVYDKDCSGEIRSGSQLFGNYSFSLHWKDGYEALASLDDNHDGRIDGTELTNLAVWQDSNCDGRSTKAEVHSLSEFSVKSLSYSARADSDHILSCEKGVTFSTNETRRTYDFFLKELP